MLCPRDGTELLIETAHDIEVDHCAECNGHWLDHHELDELESVRSTAEERRATIEYAKRESELDCPVCGNRMIAFNYRAYNLELDTCEQEHGFWLDAGEDGRVHDIIDERVRGLERSATAEQSWNKFLEGAGSKGVWGSVSSFFRGRRR